MVARPLEGRDTILVPSGDQEGATVNVRWRVSRLNPLPSAFTEQISNRPCFGFLAQAKAILVPSGDQLESPSTPSRSVSLVKAEPSGSTENRFAPSLVGRSKTSLPLFRRLGRPGAHTTA